MSTALATLAGKLAERVGMDSVDPQELITTLRQTAFKGDASDAQFIALLIVANQYGLNPWTKEIYASPDKQNGIVPVVGVDGWSRIINENQQFDGMDFEQDNESCTCRIYRKDRTGIDVRAVEQGDDAWHKLRLGVITASEVHNVIAKPRSEKKWPDMKMSYFHTLLAEVCTGVTPEVNAKALAWGKQYENDARTLFEFTSGVNVTESPIIYRDESMRTACSPDGLCSDGNGLELKCPFTSRDFMKFRLGGFEAIKSAYMAQVQYSMWVTRKDAWYFANYDPRMKREGLHYVVIERNEKYMASFDEMVPEFIEKMDEALAEIGFVFGEQWR